MNKFSSSQEEDPGNGRSSEEDIQDSIYLYDHEVNITYGVEFLDDTIRMKDQPLEEAHRKD